MALGQPDEDVIEATLTADGGQTILVWEERGMPLDLLAAYGAGVQIHVEDLAAYLAGRDRVDVAARWDELQPAYQTWRPTSARTGRCCSGFDLGLSTAGEAFLRCAAACRLCVCEDNRIEGGCCRRDRCRAGAPETR